MSIFDLDNYTDAVSDAVDAIGDAGDLIGGVLKTVSPILAMVPGLGTAFAVAVYAAGAIAAKDPITDAVIGSAAAAMPPGLPRIAFDGAANITKDVANGKNIVNSTIEALRQTASKAGGPQAVAALDSGVAMVRGGKVDARLIKAGRDYAFTTGGQAAAASYDAGVAIAKGEGADQVVLDVARGYIQDMGGPLAIGAFDTGVALGYGKTMQEAGYTGLHSLVRGNDPIEKILNFVEQVGRAKTLKMGLEYMLQSELAYDFAGTMKNMGLPSNAANVTKVLDPYIKAIKDNRALLEIPSSALAKQWRVDETIARAAQSVMIGGMPNLNLLKMLTTPPANTFELLDSPGTKERNDALQKVGYQRALDDSDVMKSRNKIGEYGPQLSIDATWRRGFDIGTATCLSHTEWGPGQEAIRNSLTTQSQYNGFNAARNLQYTKNIIKAAALKVNPAKPTISLATNASTYSLSEEAKQMAIQSFGRLGGPLDATPRAPKAEVDSFAFKGAQIAAADRRVAASRALVPDGEYRRGFDVGIGVSTGYSLPGPGQDRVRNSCKPIYGGSDAALAGFDIARALAYGLTKQGDAGKSVMLSPDPNVASGQLVANGLVNSGFTSDEKAGVITTAIRDPLVKQGAAAVIEEKKSFFRKILSFFGL